MAALRGRLVSFRDAPVAGRIARLIEAPLVFGLLVAGRLAGVLLFLLGRRSRNSSSSGSPSLLSLCSSNVALSASTPLSSLSPRFRFALSAGLAVDASFSGFLVTLPLRRRVAADAPSSTGEGETAALMVIVLDGWRRDCVVGFATRHRARQLRMMCFGRGLDA